MTQTFEGANRLGKEFLDSSMRSFATVSKGAQAISGEASDYAKKAFEAGSAAVEKLLSVKSVEKAVELQADYARQVYEGLVAEAARTGELYADMAKEAYRPFESIAAKAK